jgi:hypothetical protein
MLGGSLVTTARRGWRRPQGMEGSCEYIESAVDGQQGVVLQLGGWVWG